MNIDMDEEMRAYQLRNLIDSRPSLAHWLFIISFGVFLGNVASFGLERAVLYWELKQVSIAATAALEQTNRNFDSARKAQAAKLAEQNKLRLIQDQDRQFKQEQKQAGLRQANETCNFWKQQLQVENTEQNRIYKNEACSMVSRFR